MSIVLDNSANFYVGGNAGEEILALGGDDTVYGAGGDDIIRGGTGDDMLFGQHGDDHLAGGDGDDWLVGGHGDDTLNGNDGDDTLIGGNGDDILNGGEGDDLLVGGEGRDIFRFFKPSGDDTISDFVQGEDLIHIIARGVPGFDALVISSDAAGNATVTWNVNNPDPANVSSVVLVGVAADDLTSSDFLFS